MNNELYQQLYNLFMSYKGVGFVSLQYKNKHGELSKRLLNVGANYDNAKKSDLKLLENGIEYVPSNDYTQADWNTALMELKESLTTPNAVLSQAQSNAYMHFNDYNYSIKYNFEQKEIYLFAKSEKKEVLQAGTKKEVKSSPKTLAKKAIGEFLKTTKFRTFILKGVRGTVKVNGQTLDIIVD